MFSVLHNLRLRLSSALVRLAKRIYPRNPEVDAFLAQRAIDQMTYGLSVSIVSPKDIYKPPNVRNEAPPSGGRLD
jgi:hypothetical protein